jgi:hypothetical protein
MLTVLAGLPGTRKTLRDAGVGARTLPTCLIVDTASGTPEAAVSRITAPLAGRGL